MEILRNTMAMERRPSYRCDYQFIRPSHLLEIIYVITREMFRTFVQLEVERLWPKVSNVGRPCKLSYDTAFNAISRLVRTGMQWREMGTQHYNYSTVFKIAKKWSNAQ
eukprot:423136-Pleurochrysis_carterae.AAC.2